MNSINLFNLDQQYEWGVSEKDFLDIDDNSIPKIHELVKNGRFAAAFEEAGNIPNEWLKGRAQAYVCKCWSNKPEQILWAYEYSKTINDLWYKGKAFQAVSLNSAKNGNWKVAQRAMLEIPDQINREPIQQILNEQKI